MKMVYEIALSDFTTKTINKFLSIEKNALIQILSKGKFLGFQILKNWDISESELYDIMKNPYILKSLENDQIIYVIKILKDIRYLANIQEIGELFVQLERKASSYEVADSSKFILSSSKYKDRIALLKRLKNARYLVSDFGDFELYNKGKLLHIYRINEKYLEIYCVAIYDLIKDINKWFDLTGGEFVIDTKIFRIGYQVAQKTEIGS